MSSGGVVWLKIPKQAGLEGGSDIVFSAFGYHYECPRKLNTVSIKLSTFRFANAMKPLSKRDLDTFSRH